MSEIAKKLVAFFSALHSRRNRAPPSMNFHFQFHNRQYFLAIVLLISGLLFLLSNFASAQISLSGISYSQNFDSMGSTGTTTPTGWTVDLTANTGASGTTTDTP